MDENKTHGLSATWLKYFACFFMVIDHTDGIFHLLGGVAGPDDLLFYLFRFLGRLSFPIFAYLLAEGCRRTRDLPKYLGRLAIFAAVSQLPFVLAFGQSGGSVILTFFLAAGGIFLYQKVRAGRRSHVAALLPVLAAALLAWLTDSDYGWMGVLIVFALYLCGEDRKRQSICLAVSLFLLYFAAEVLRFWSPVLLPLLQGADPILVWRNRQGFLSFWWTFLLPYCAAVTCSALLALVPLYFYNGERGRGSKWFFYIFYPAHLLVLWAIKSTIGQ